MHQLYLLYTQNILFSFVSTQKKNTKNRGNILHISFFFSNVKTSLYCLFILNVLRNLESTLLLTRKVIFRALSLFLLFRALYLSLPTEHCLFLCFQSTGSSSSFRALYLALPTEYCLFLCFQSTVSCSAYRALYLSLLSEHWILLCFQSTGSCSAFRALDLAPCLQSTVSFSAYRALSLFLFTVHFLFFCIQSTES